MYVFLFKELNANLTVNILNQKTYKFSDLPQVGSRNNHHQSAANNATHTRSATENQNKTTNNKKEKRETF